MGLCLWLDKDLAMNHFDNLIDGIQFDSDSIKEISMKSLIDIFIRFGMKPFQKNKYNKSITELMSLITVLLNSKVN